MYHIKKILCLCISLLVLFIVGFTNKTLGIVDNNYYKEFNVPQYVFSGGIIKDAHVIQYDNFQIVQPLYMNKNKQTLTYNQVANEFKKVPKVLTENIREIQLLDYKSTMDEYFEKVYKTKKFRTYASGGNHKINFFANDELSVDLSSTINIKILMPTLVHESAHTFDVVISNEKYKFSNSDEWHDIMQKDFNFKNIYNFKLIKIKIFDYGKYCSKYSSKSDSSVEDFADSVEGYVLDKEDFTKEFPNRSKKIEQLFNEN